MNEYAVYTPWAWRDRLRNRLLPTRICELPEADARFADCIVHTTVTHFSLLDRLRILVTGTVRVDSKIVCENMVGRTIGSSVAYPVLKEAPPEET